MLTLLPLAPENESLPPASAKDRYVLRNLTGENHRLAHMSHLLDPLHQSLLEKVGIRPGWRCLEIGCGNGSISQWMAAKVGPKGRVVATDLNLSYTGDLHAPNLEVRQLDILKPLPALGKFDLVTGRAVLHHVCSPKTAVHHMVELLKPGGVLLSIEPDFLPATAATPEPLHALWQGWLGWAKSVGIDYFIGHAMPGLLTSHGLDHIAAEGTTEFYRGNSSWSKYWLETLEELHPRLLESGYITAPVYSRFKRLYSDPRVWTSAITFVGAWGTKPRS